MTFPVFSAGEVLRAQDMNAVGLWLVKTQTVGTGVISATVTGAFSADYDAYKIIWSNGTQSVDIGVNMTLGSANANYYLAFVYGSYAGGSPVLQSNSNAQQWSFSGGGGSAIIELNNPFLTKSTEMQARVRYSTLYGNSVGHLADFNSYTSFTLTANSGTMTGGTIRVYGYKN
jgi:hypothetical protein